MQPWEIQATHTTDEDDGLQTLAHDGDERQEKQGPLALPALFDVVALELTVLHGVVGNRRVLALLERSRQLESPLHSGSVHFEESNAHHVDDDAGDDGEDTFPNFLGLAPQVGQLCVKLGLSAQADTS